LKNSRIAILTGGGDCPGLNAVIRAITKKAVNVHSLDVVGIEDGYEGLVQGRQHSLAIDRVSGILTLGGTILGTSNVANPYKYPVRKGDTIVFEDVSKKVFENIRALKTDCLVCIGGDGTLGIAWRLSQDGIPVVGVPKTIDNDLHGTDITFGFDTAVQVATEAIDRVHTTAQSHHRVMIVEVMGRRAGWIALYSGLAGGGDIILIPEIPYEIDILAEAVKARSRRGKRFSIVVVAEGAKPVGGDAVVRRVVKDASDPVRFRGVGFVLGKQIEDITGLETRTVVLGHLQRGGIPTPFDRILGTRLGTFAVDMITGGEFGYMAGIRGTFCVSVPLEEAAKGYRTVSPDHPLISAARSLGTCLGDGAGGNKA
jgi:6-phosphofructokinase 1